jgi:hypothetical protein
MARMVPETADPEAPDSEKRVFQLLRDDAATANWIVFHSLGLSSAYSGAYGEIDFVALIPSRGLLCVEVKGGRVQCAQGIWTTTNRRGETSAFRRSPFQQAREGMFKLRAAIRQRFGEASPEANSPIGWAVIFTDSLAPPSSPEFHRDELLDSRDLQHSPGTKLQSVPSLKASVQAAPVLSQAAILNISRFLRPDFDRIPTLATTLWDAERRFVALTEEQYDVLDHVVANESSVVTGGAGTGKTLLAVELARRLSAKGRDVLLTCFNRELGNWLEHRCRGFGPGRVVAGHLHRLLRPRLEAAGLLREAEASTSPEGWYEAGAVAIAGSIERFDTVIVDEAQDFPAAALLDIIEVWRRSEDAAPGLCLFADFSRQALYGAPGQARETIRRRLRPAAFPLRRNCRNTRKIAAETLALVGVFDVKVSEDQPAGPSVERIFFGGVAPQKKALDRALQMLRAEGFNGSDVVILGPSRRENSCLADVQSCGGFRIVERDARTATAGVVYSTIQAFKGLESPAVVLVDLELKPDQLTDALLYVGMTRARTRLVMLLPEAARDEVVRRERENLAAALS